MDAFFRVGMGVLVMIMMAAAPLCSAANHEANSGARSPWVATWGAAMLPVNSWDAPDFTGKTLREVVHSSVGGGQVRVWLSNRFGSQPLYVGAAHIAITSSQTSGVNKDGTTNQSGIQAGSDRTLTFHGGGSVTIPAGAAIVSDPVSLKVPPLTDLSVSIYLPRHTLGLTTQDSSQQISYIATGNQTSAAGLASKSWTESPWYFLSEIDVYAPGSSAVVTLGDSITVGAYSTLNGNCRWPDDLAVRLAKDPGTRRAGVLGVVNAGIDGSRVLLNGYGPNALARLNWDVLTRSGVRYLIVLEGINDLNLREKNHQSYDDLLEPLETGFAQMVTQAHQHGIRVFGGTLLPYKNSRYYSPAGDQVREAVNNWIRTSGTFDGVIDFEKAVRDPQHPSMLAAQYDSGDHGHPNDAGYQAMANIIDLSLFTGTK